MLALSNPWKVGSKGSSHMPLTVITWTQTFQFWIMSRESLISWPWLVPPTSPSYPPFSGSLNRKAFLGWCDYLVWSLQLRIYLVTTFSNHPMPSFILFILDTLHTYIMFIIGDFLSFHRLRTREIILNEFMNWVEYTQEVYELGRIYTRSSWTW